MSKPAVVLVHGFWGDAPDWSKVVVELDRRGYGSLRAVENRFTSLADDPRRTQQMIKQIDGPVLLVGHCHGGAVITEAGDLPNSARTLRRATHGPADESSPDTRARREPRLPRLPAHRRLRPHRRAGSVS
jgi:pimeloyl-ACP methyl ester carboxylesterase